MIGNIYDTGKSIDMIISISGDFCSVIELSRDGGFLGQRHFKNMELKGYKNCKELV